MEAPIVNDVGAVLWLTQLDTAENVLQLEEFNKAIWIPLVDEEQLLTFTEKVGRGAFALKTIQLLFSIDPQKGPVGKNVFGKSSNSPFTIAICSSFHLSN